MLRFIFGDVIDVSDVILSDVIDVIRRHCRLSSLIIIIMIHYNYDRRRWKNKEDDSINWED
jgi:hypothetical protein